MRRFFDSMLHRIFVLLFAGMLFAAGITNWLASREHHQLLDELHNYRVANRVERIVSVLDQATPAMLQMALQPSESFGVQLKVIHAFQAVPTDNPALLALLHSRLGMQRPIFVSSQKHACLRDGQGNQNAVQAIFPLQMVHPNVCQVIVVGLKNGAFLELKLPFIRPTWPRQHFAYRPFFILFLVLIALLAYGVARMTVRPITRMAQAALALGRDINQTPLHNGGPLETRQAAQAFNAMQARIKRQIQHRTHMLAAITHDLQTPLTRLRLRMEKVTDNELRAKLIDDLAVMQSMVREGLDLARSMDSTEAKQRLDIDSLLDSLCADAVEMGQDVILQGKAGVSVLAQPLAIRRCLTNLIDNAVKYGQYARINVAYEKLVDQQRVVILIRDGGIGIPDEQLSRVFEPFFRLEGSRSRDTGGTGLGLAIARNIAENHQASLTLSNHPDGGLVVTLRLLVEMPKVLG